MTHDDAQSRPTHPDNTFQGRDPRIIEVDQASERAYWCKSLGISEADLIALVAAVGPSAQSVKNALGLGGHGER
jgi:hypothetical protein